VTERVFAWPGIGQRIVEAILGRDYPVVQAVVLVTALLFMLINLLVDLDLHVPRSTVADVSAALGAVALLASIVRGRRRPAAVARVDVRMLRAARRGGDLRQLARAVFEGSREPRRELAAACLGIRRHDGASARHGSVGARHPEPSHRRRRGSRSRRRRRRRSSAARSACWWDSSPATSGALSRSIAMRIVDAFLALPFILLALALVATLGTGFGNIIMVMVIANWARYARLVRSEVLSVKQRDFVTLARIAGVRPFVIMLRHVLPNVLNSVVVLAILDVGRAIILESSLSFLGVGIQPPDVSWGLMLADGRTLMGFAWWLTTLPGLMIVFAVLSFNSLGRWLHVRFDPRGQL
jgi:ABC-type phosphate/phosphonate transport system permease subunit